MTNAHTRGPWTAHRGKKTIGIYEPTGVAVGYVHTSKYTEARKAADAALIAAAPDLLKLLRDVMDVVEVVLDDSPEMDAWLDQARAAIAKVEGR